MAFKFQAQKAVREKVFTKLALMAPSGGGKTYSALRIATGMANQMEKTTGKKGRILLGNTENGRGKYYADQFDYDIVDLEAPYNPELFVGLIDYAVAEKYDILIIDSTSPEWEGRGGCLELQQQAGGKYQDWSKVTPRHDKFIQAIASSPIHIIATMRGKDQYEVEKDEKGRVSIKKLGVGAKQREGFEYEFTCTFTIDLATNLATSQKDNTHIFENDINFFLSEEHGEKLIKWANSGESYSSKPVKFEGNPTYNTEEDSGSVSEDEKLKDKICEISTLVKSAMESGVERSVIAEAVQKENIVNGKHTANYNGIKDYDIACKVLESVKAIVV